jgi:hypothetical protein
MHIQDSKESLIKSLSKRLKTLRLLSKSAPFETIKKIADGIIMSKILYGIETWGVAPKYLLAKIQKAQLEACIIINGRQSQRWSTTHLLKSVSWLSVSQLVTLTSAKLSHKILAGKGPTLLTQKMTPADTVRSTRLSGPK